MTDIKFTIHPVFPKPIYRTFLKKKLTKKDIQYANNIRLRHKNEGNTNSRNSYILNGKHFNKLKIELENIVKNYVDNVICPQYNIKPYITQSWFNYTSSNEYHHKHAHSNSILSGVLYFTADPTFDSIIFSRNRYEPMSIEKKSYNLYNSDTWKFSVQSNQVILFPSDLMHQVEMKKGNNLRISLAFNVFFKGKLGHRDSLTELILK